MTLPTDPAAKFDASRAGEYLTQSRIALAGYDACHELAACLLSAAIGADREASILVAGAGGSAMEMITAARLAPKWRFHAVDPSAPMLDLAMSRTADARLADRVTSQLGVVADVQRDRSYNAATLIGVLHHLPGEDAKRAILIDIAARLAAGAPFILACNHYAYAEQPLLLSAWGERWRMQGASEDEVKQKLGKILQGADPPHSEQAVLDLLAEAGFERPQRFFSSLFWGAWICWRR
ncbi:class I SAM-dependent methyltransferase [Neorhizobium sp. P12A]|uniref:methyltransferase n=1 Tax=Rhizobium/Agrobacterium group TaxID=227290 RepID=UPI00104FEB32|nr:MULTISPECIES: class I SAM-dependent methyltransferase [Rhizobium/Agrobacterium group]KAA0697673.1 class I SAM-dependent methyltransferase [Neorhizobium sp. P12A]TCR83891.1 tRNA (cmo5U34)-methyltransferase [Rhizobium sp. BK376]